MSGKEKDGLIGVAGLDFSVPEIAALHAAANTILGMVQEHPEMIPEDDIARLGQASLVSAHAKLSAFIQWTKKHNVT